MPHIEEHWAPVLIVDDDESIRQALRGVLELEGFTVLEASDGVHALDLLNRTLSPLVILTNHQMPRLDGPGLIDMVHHTPALLARTAIVYMTAGNRILSPTFAQQLQDLDVPVVRKPFDIDDIARAVVEAEQRLFARTQGETGGTHCANR